MVYILSENNVGLDEFLPALMNHSRNLQRKFCIMNILQLKNIKHVSVNDVLSIVAFLLLLLF